jgi:hypothetical protein
MPKELPIDSELFQLEDGFYYYWPEGCKGCFSADSLRQIADQLDTKNKDWDDQLNDYMLNAKYVEEVKQDLLH